MRSRNLEQSKYDYLMKTFKPISKDVGYDILEESNDEIKPVSKMNNDNQQLVIFDDRVTLVNRIKDRWLTISV